MGAAHLARPHAAPAPADTGVACPCGGGFTVHSAEALDHLVAAVQEHALHSHGHELTREHILAEARSIPVLSATA